MNQRTVELFTHGKPKLQPCFGVARLALFGSVVRDAASSDSYIDNIVAFDGPPPPNIISQYASGSTFKEVSAMVQKTVRISLPDSNDVGPFSKSVEPIFKSPYLLEQENQHLTQLRDWLLPMLMNSQIMME